MTGLRRPTPQLHTALKAAVAVATVAEGEEVLMEEAGEEGRKKETDEKEREVVALTRVGLAKQQ